MLSFYSLYIVQNESIMILVFILFTEYNDFIFIKKIEILASSETLFLVQMAHQNDLAILSSSYDPLQEHFYLLLFFSFYCSASGDLYSYRP